MRIIIFTISIAFALLTSTFLVAQDLASLAKTEGENLKRFDNNMAIATKHAGKGPMAKSGDYVKVVYTGRLVNGNVFDKNENDEPLVFQLGMRQVIPGWEFGLTQLKAGEKATFYIPSDLAYGNRPVGDVIPANADLIFDIQLLEVMNQDAYDLYMEQEEEKAKKAFELKKKKRFQAELHSIRDYIKNQKLKAKSLDSGLSVVVGKRGKKPLITDGQKVSVSYKGYLLDGTLFDEAGKNEPFGFEAGAGKVIQGWEEAISFFGKGGMGKLIIPSALAYGPRPITEGKITIPGNSVLIFDIKIVDVE